MKSKESIIENENVKSMIDKFDLSVPKYFLYVTDYGIDFKGMIQIREVEVRNVKGEYVKTVDNLLKLVNHLSDFTIEFKKK